MTKTIDGRTWRDFPDPAMEARFQIERFRSGATRQRIVLAACAVVSMALGLFEAFHTALYMFEGLVMKIHIIRCYVVVPMWVALGLATYAPWFPRLGNSLNAMVIICTSWGHSLITWLLLVHRPTLDLTNALTGSTILVLTVAILVVPLRLRTLIMTVTLSTGVPILVFWYSFGPNPQSVGQLVTATFSLSLIAALLILGGWFREIAEKRFFLQREQAQVFAAELARRDAEKDEYMAIAAHDLRAPLAGMSATLDLLVEGRIKDPEQSRSQLTELRRRTGAMIRLVDDFLNAYALERGQLPVRQTRVDLGEVIADVPARFGNLAAAKGQSLVVHPTRAPVWVRADVNLMQQIADNFVSNALKFSPPGSRVELEVQVAVEIGKARLVVIDQGPGLTATDQSKLFRMFGKAGPRPTGGEPSSGLGLAVAKRLAEAMEARVGCDSDFGAGAAFWVELALAR